MIARSYYMLHIVKSTLCLLTFSLYNDSVRVDTVIISPFYRWENWVVEQADNLPSKKFTYLGSRDAEI